MTEGTPPRQDDPQSPGDQPPPGQQPPPYGQPFGQPPAPGQQPHQSPAAPPSYTPPAHDEPSWTQGSPGQQSTHAPQQYGQPPSYAHAATSGVGDRRPGTVLAAAIVTWVFAGLALVGSAVMLLGVSADRDGMVDDLENDQNIEDLGWTPDEIVDALNLVSIVAIVLSLVAIVLAVMAFQRSNGGRMALVALSGVTALLTLAGSIFCIPAFWLIASVATIVLLFAGGANDWYARRTPGQPTGPQPGDYGQWPQA